MPLHLGIKFDYGQEEIILKSWATQRKIKRKIWSEIISLKEEFEM